MTVLIVDDHSSFRAQVRRLLEDAGHEVVGEAEDGATAIAAVLELRPSLVVLDVQLPDIDGFEVAEHLARQAAGTAVVMISTREAGDYRTRLAMRPDLRFICKADLSADALATALGGAP
jgi:DNA-binding NarL/FixJ family response regulator